MHVAKRILALVSALALVLSAAAPAVAEMKIALIIPQKLIAKSKAGQDAAEKLKAKKEAAQRQSLVPELRLRSGNDGDAAQPIHAA